jgi:hypothetical protein
MHEGSAMSQHWAPPRFFLIGFCGLCFTSTSAAAPPTLNDLSMEVAALQTLYQFRFTPAQMVKLKKLAAETTDDAGARQAVAVSDGFRRALGDVWTALVQADKEERIADLLEKLEDLRDTENPELDDAVEITDAARRRAPEVLAWLSARQIAAYIAAYGDQFPDPLELMVEALGKVRDLKDEAWKQMRDEVSEEVGRLVAGLDTEKAGQVSDQVVQLLIQARALKEDEFKKERRDLEKSARQIVGEVGPLQVLRHAVERALAELLSNPRLPTALEARLKK